MSNPIQFSPRLFPHSQRTRGQRVFQKNSFFKSVLNTKPTAGFRDHDAAPPCPICLPGSCIPHPNAGKTAADAAQLPGTHVGSIEAAKEGSK
jgi:hypothetical protein